MFLIFSSNFAGTDIFPGLPLLRYPSSILPLFPRPPLTLGHIPRALSPIQSSSLALFLALFLASFLVLFLVLFIASSSPLPLPSHSSPPPSFASTYPHQHFLTSSFPRFPKPLPLLSPPTPCITHLRATLQPLPHIPTNTSSPHISLPGTTPVTSTRHFQKLPIKRSIKPPLPPLLFLPIFRPPGNPSPPSKSPSHFLADFLNALRAPGEVPCRMSPEVILRLESVGN